MEQESKSMEIQRWRKMPVVVEATQWFKNGDHPQDFVGMEVPNSNGDGGVHERMEGLVVRFFRHPAIRGVEQCKHCNVTMHAHGWIDTLEGGHIVCPGDWIIKGVKGEFYPCKPDIFAATYEPESTPDHAAAIKAAQDAIAVEKRALLNANAELREDTERMRVMREALEKAVWRDRSQFQGDPFCVLCGAGQKWAAKHGHERNCALASTAPVYGPAIVAPKFITHECHCPVEHYSDIPAGTCLVCGGTAPVALTEHIEQVAAQMENAPDWMSGSAVNERTAPVAATCSKPAAALVPRLGLSWACVLTKGHTGNCQPGGSCRAHGPYVGTPHCPHPVEECVRILMDRSSAPVAEAGQKERE